uniref:Speckle targeted PIP5K1A-regulated poly(A)polymerase-like n=1 Tax=Psoroptes ovis TaxID=83912 RepID=A0A3B0QNW8_PSOOV|nr:speckle targeted PIP5K1A-regulated poly(A)polymerase-like [Psoroptes ovis]
MKQTYRSTNDLSCNFLKHWQQIVPHDFFTVNDISSKLKPIDIPDIIAPYQNLSVDERLLVKRKEFNEILSNIKMKSNQNVLYYEILNYLKEKLLLPKPLVDQRRKMIDQLENLLNNHKFKCKLQIYGSIDAGLAFKDNSDIDVFVNIPNSRLRCQSLTYLSEENFEEIRDHMREIRRILKNNHEILFPHGVNVETLLNRNIRVPLLRLTVFSEICEYNEFSEFNPLSIKCDLNINCALGLANTRLIRLFCKLDARFMAIAILVRLWVKNLLPDYLIISPYASTLLVVFYFQQKSIIPSVDYLIKHSSNQYRLFTNGCRTDFCTDFNFIKDNFPSSICKENIHQLFIGFFEYYSRFDFHKNYICTNTARILIKNNYPTNIVELYDPFDLKHNVTRKVNIDQLIHHLIQVLNDIIVGVKCSLINDEASGDCDEGTNDCSFDCGSNCETEYGSVSGNNPGGGFSPIFIMPNDGSRCTKSV